MSSPLIPTLSSLTMYYVVQAPVQDALEGQPYFYCDQPGPQASTDAAGNQIIFLNPGEQVGLLVALKVLRSDSPGLTGDAPG